MTTEQSLFWVDPGELSQLLSAAGVGTRPRPVELLAPPQPAAPSTLPVAESPAASAPKDVPPGSFEERLRALLDWVYEVTNFQHAFVVDEDGLALVHESARLEMIAAGAMMTERYESLRNRFDLSAGTYLAIGLGADEMLHLLALRSTWGLLSLGFVAADPVTPQNIAAIHQQFRRTLEAEGAL